MTQSHDRDVALVFSVPLSGTGNFRDVSDVALNGFTELFWAVKLIPLRPSFMCRNINRSSRFRSREYGDCLNSGTTLLSKNCSVMAKTLTALLIVKACEGIDIPEAQMTNQYVLDSFFRGSCDRLKLIVRQSTVFID